MGHVIEATGVRVDAFPSHEVTVAARAGELVSLLFSDGGPALRILRAMARLERNVAGSVAVGHDARVALAAPGAPLADLAAHVQLVLFHASDAPLDAASWSALDAHRGRGAAVIVATTAPADAFRCERAVLVGFSISDAANGFEASYGRLEAHMRELLARLNETGHSERVALREIAAALLAENRVARGFVRELRARARGHGERESAARLAAKLAGVSLDD